jgi:probable HAF family extracellular repeat protein
MRSAQNLWEETMKCGILGLSGQVFRFERLFFASILLSLLAPVAAAQGYKIVDLGSLGGNYSEAYAVNDFGHVAGDSCLDPACNRMHPFIWSESTGMHDLGTLPGGNPYAVASGINLWDEVAGSSAFAQGLPGDTHAFVWGKREGMHDLGTLGCPDITGANGINIFGQVTGTSTIEPCPGGGQYRAFLWSPNEGMRDLGTLPGGTYSLGNAINAFGQVAGYSDCANCSGSHAFLWYGSGMLDLGVLSGGSVSFANGLNDFAVVVGYSDSAHSTGEAFVWTLGDGMLNLGTLPGGMWSYASAVSECGEVVGSSDSTMSKHHAFARRKGRLASDAAHAFLWTRDEGMIDLNNRIIPAKSGWLLTDARAINSLGQIAGVGTIHGQTHAFLLNPIGREHGGCFNRDEAARSGAE